MALGPAVNSQRYVRIAIHGPTGSGKTLTGLMCGEELAIIEEARMAMYDSERGADFYTEAVSTRTCHPAAFSFEADYDKSLWGVTQFVKNIVVKKHRVVLVDSMTHVWEAARNSYTGPKGDKGQIPIWAWGPIKEKYKAIMDGLQNLQAHVIIIGREGVEYGETDDGTDGVIGKKMKAEAETEYEMNMSIRMERVGQKRRTDKFAVRAIVEKDRTGIMQGKVIVNPTFKTLLQPVMRMLTAKRQGKIQTAEEIQRKDSEKFAGTDHAKEAKSSEIKMTLRTMLNEAKNPDDLKLAYKHMQKQKPGMTPSDIAITRHLYQDMLDRFSKTSDTGREKGQLLQFLEPIVLGMDPKDFHALVGDCLKGRHPEWSDGFELLDLRALKNALQNRPAQQTELV